VAEIPTTPEVVEFVANLLKGTRAGAIDWKSGAENEIVADIGGDYRVILREIPDLDGQNESPDQLITLQTQESRLFTLSRLDLSAEELGNALDERVDFSYQVFSELWNRAFLNATKMDQHLSAVNRALGQQIRTKTERRLPPES